jgi:phosphatidylglycerol:prolipoprotein diacylglycerol transferase
VHPTPLYECAAYLAVFALLWRWRREDLPEGTILAWYLILASAARFVIEFVRINPVVAFGLTQAQLTGLALIACGTTILVVKRAWRPAAA